MQTIKYCTYVILTALLLACSSPQLGHNAMQSGFDPEQIDSAMVENLVVLGRVWGFVKYHHPAFVDNRYDIDREFFDLLPQVADATPDERNEILIRWIDRFGEITTDLPKYAGLIAASPGRYNTDVRWPYDTVRFSKRLIDRLLRLRLADRNGNYHVNTGRTRNPVFNHEKSYSGYSQPDYGLRLLAVSRFWNMVEYFFPCKYMTDKQWDEVLPEYIVRMFTLPDGDYLHTVWRMVTELNDNHAQTDFDELFGRYRVFLDTRFVEGRLVVATPDTIPYTTYRVPFQVGDEILAVDGRTIDQSIARVREYVPCSNEGDVLYAAQDIALRCKQREIVPIRYKRNGIERDTLVKPRAPFSSNRLVLLWGNKKRYELLPDSIGYIYAQAYKPNTKDLLDQTLYRTKGLVIDIRCHPSAEFMDFIAQHIIPADSNNVLTTYPNVSFPGTFSSSDGYRHGKEGSKYDRRIVVLVDSRTQSYAESCVQWIQNNPSVVVVGSQSAGANGNVSDFVLPRDIQSKFSGLGWYYTDGTEVLRNGVKIDIEVHPTVQGIIANRDEVLETAIDIIRKKTEIPENL